MMQIRGKREKGNGTRRRLLRIRVVELGLFGFAFLIAVKAVDLQVIESRELSARALRQHQQVIKVFGQRGSIYDWKGKELAVSLEEVSLAVDPQRFDSRKNLSRLARLLSLAPGKLAGRIRKEGAFAWVVRGINPNLAARIAEADIPGVILVPEWRRFYPQGETAGHALGFVGIDQIGLEGIEFRYDSWLRGQPNFFLLRRDGQGRGISSRLEQVSDPGREGEEAGADIFLTLDLNVQYLLERALSQGVRENRARGGVALALGAASGRIRALAVANSSALRRRATWADFSGGGESRLGFDPNVFGDFSPGEWRNRGVTDSYEPGSTFKVFLLAAALEEKLVRPGTRLDCEGGSYAIGPDVIHDHKPNRTLTLTEVLMHSSNIGAVKIGELLGRKNFHRYLDRFGFGRPTGVDLPGEAATELRPPERWRPVDLATACFGQGVAVTPIQLAAAFAATINGGELYRPYLVEKAVNRKGQVLFRNRPTLVRRVISPSTSRVVRRILERVVTEGTGQRAQVPGVVLLGKTGTTQKFDFARKEYSSERLISSFLGVIPRTALAGISPEPAEEDLVVLVVIDEPHGPGWGGEVAAPVFGELVRTGGAVLALAGRQN